MAVVVLQPDTDVEVEVSGLRAFRLWFRGLRYHPRDDGGRSYSIIMLCRPFKLYVCRADNVQLDLRDGEGEGLGLKCGVRAIPHRTALLKNKFWHRGCIPHQALINSFVL